MQAQKVLDEIKLRFPNEPEYHQAVEEVLSTIEEEYNKHPEFEKVKLIERLCIPDRVYQFRVNWVDDKGEVQTNMGYRVQHNNCIGPYKGAPWAQGYAGPKGLRGFEHNKFSSTLISATDPLRHFLRK